MLWMIGAIVNLSDAPVTVETQTSFFLGLVCCDAAISTVQAEFEYDEILTVQS